MTENSPNQVIIRSDGTQTFLGPAATRWYGLNVVIKALEFEIRTGMRMSRFSTIARAKQLTGNKTNSKHRQIIMLQAMADMLGQEIEFIKREENTPCKTTP